MLQSLLTVIAPLIVSIVTQAGKYLVPFVAQLKSGWIIAGVAVLSFITAIGQAALTGQPVDATSIQTLSDTIVNLLGATGAYFLAGKVSKTS